MTAECAVALAGARPACTGRDELRRHGARRHGNQRQASWCSSHRLSCSATTDSSSARSSSDASALLDFAHLRERAWQKIAFNASADALSLLARDGGLLDRDRSAESPDRQSATSSRDAVERCRVLLGASAARWVSRSHLVVASRYVKVLSADRSRSRSARFRLRCWGWGSGGCTWSSVPRSSRCSSSRS